MVTAQPDWIKPQTRTQLVAYKPNMPPQEIVDTWIDAIECVWFPLAISPTTSPQTESAEEQFRRLAKTWREETENLSSLTRIVSHPAYQQIIDLGKGRKPVVSLILNEWQDRGGYWATALSSISGENPVAPEHIGNPAKVREDWIAWGRVRGYL